MSLTTTIKTIQDIMRKDVGVDGDAQRIGQLVWMLFLKILDEQEKRIEQTDKKYISPLKETYRWRKWAVAEAGVQTEEENQKNDDKLIAFVNVELFPALKNPNSYQGDSKLREVIHGVFQDAYNYMRSGTLLRQVISKIEEDIPLKNFEDQQHLGDVYEKLLRDLQSAGNAGEFYTPRAVTEFIIDRIAPRIGETILDPACGTGGFLAQAVDYLEKNKPDESAETLQKIQDAPQGIEKKPLPHMLAVTNMLLHGIKEPHRIQHSNTLGLYADWSEERKAQIVVTNPPFGGIEEDGIEAPFPDEFKTRETADLFIHFIYTKMLQNGGRCAIVLPDGFLFGEGIKNRIKEDLMEKCNLHTIIRLPNGVFNPYTSIRTNILFFEKTEKTKDATKTIWFYEHPYPEGYKTYSKTRPMQFSEFKLEQAWWRDVYDLSTYEQRQENQYAWKINFLKEKQDVLARAEPYYKRVIEYEQHKQQKNEQVRQLNTEIRKLRQNIKSLNADQETLQKKLNEEIKEKDELNQQLRREVAELDRRIKAEQATGDRIKYTVYNLDRKNPRSIQENVVDPDELLDELRLIYANITEIQNLLRNELTKSLLQEME